MTLSSSELGYCLSFLLEFKVAVGGSQESGREMDRVGWGSGEIYLLFSSAFSDFGFTLLCILLNVKTKV